MPEEVLDVANRPPLVAWVRVLMGCGAAVIVSLAIVVGALQGPEEWSEPGVLASPDSKPIRLLVLGDASASEESCPGCLTYSRQFADAMSDDGRVVQLHDATWRVNASPGASVAGMIGLVRVDPEVRRAVSEADVVVLAMGSADLRPVQHTNCAAGTIRGQSAHNRRPDCANRSLALMGRRLQTLADLISGLRQDRPAALRLVTVGRRQVVGLQALRHRGSRAAQVAQLAERMATIQCSVIVRNRGLCVNLSDLTRGHGLRARDRAVARKDLMTQAEHDLVVRELLRLGRI